MATQAETDLFPGSPKEIVTTEPVAEPSEPEAAAAEEATEDPKAAPAEQAAEAVAPLSPEEVQQLRDDLVDTRKRLSTAEGRMRAVGVEQFEALNATVKRMDREQRRREIEADEALTGPQKQRSLTDLETQETKDQQAQETQDKDTPAKDTPDKNTTEEG